MLPADLALLRIPGTPTVSPDGTVAVVPVTRLDLDENEYRTQLWLVPTDGGAARVLTHGSKDGAPRISPDGRWLAFLRESAEGEQGKGKPQLHVMAMDGGDPRRLTDQPLGAGAPVWSPDSTSIAYAARIPEPGRYGTDEKITPDKEAPRLITTLQYRLDGIGFTTDRHTQLFVIDAHDEDAAPVQVTDGDFDHDDVAWSPDGSRVAFVSARHEGRDRNVANDVFTCRPDGSDLRQLTDSTTTVSSPLFAPDGRRVWYAGSGDLGPQGTDFVANQFGLWSVPVDGSAPPTRHTDAETDDVEDGNPRLTATPEGLLAARMHRGAVELFRLSWDGASRETVLDGRRQVRAHDAAAGVIVAVVARPESIGEVLVIRDGQEREVTSFGAPLSDTGRLHEMTELTTTADDGYPVHGWIVRPPGPGPHPVLLNVHGGPFTQYGWTLFDEAQVYASAGYAVVMGNPRGSSGYGAAHGRSIRQAMGDRDMVDVLAFLEAAVAEPDLDGDRVGVMGGSYGGFMTTWLVGHTDRFTAAISERAYNAPDSFLGASDIGWFFVDEYAGTDPDRVAAQSPLAFVDKIDTPTMVIHSEHDWRCAVEQAQRLFVALKLRGVETELLLFPGEGHSLSRTGLPSHRVARFEHILRWWGKHLPTSLNPPAPPAEVAADADTDEDATAAVEDHAAPATTEPTGPERPRL